MRRSSLFFIGIAVLTAILGLAAFHSVQNRQTGQQTLSRKAAMVNRLGLTDLCLFTEANYTRHPSQADLHTPFQDYPLSVEHFPSGSLMPPPPILTQAPGPQHGDVD